jgi:hypothetical protein
VLNYEQREEAEEMKGKSNLCPISRASLTIIPSTLALEARNRAGAIKIRYVG